MENEIQTNLKQIGSIAKGSKIYIEDYVMTFMKYMEDRFVCDELVFLLLGKLKEEDGETALFISGIIEAEDTEQRGGIKVFSGKGMEEALKKKERFFSGLETVGWAYVQPGYGDFLNENHISYHLSAFKEPYQVLYLTDPLDKSQVFYRQKKNSLELKPINGYFIYYDKNEPMHEYLLEVKKQAALTEAPKENPNENVDSLINLKLRGRKRKVERGFKLPEFKRPEIKLPIGEENFEPKKIAGLMSGLSFALLFVTLIIGGGLLKSNSRIDYLEKQVTSLGKNYIAMREEVGKAQEVFASKEDEQVMTEAVTEAVTEAAKEAQTEAQTEKKEVKYREYTVQSGDTLLYLSRYFYGNEDRVGDIMEANGITDAGRLIEGKTILIPE